MITSAGINAQLLHKNADDADKNDDAPNAGPVKYFDAIDFDASYIEKNNADPIPSVILYPIAPVYSP